MNKSYKSIWNAALGAWVAVSEITRAAGKRGSATSCATKSAAAACAIPIFLGAALSVALPARAADYVASSEAELRQAIIDANTDGDASSTITLTANITVTDATAFVQASKVISIDTTTFTLAGESKTGAAAGNSLSFLGGPLVVTGTVNGGSGGPLSSRGAGGDGVSVSNGTIENHAIVNGGAGGWNERSAGNPRTAGTGGSGASLVNSSIVNYGTLSGGVGGQYDNQNGSGVSSGVAAPTGGVGLIMAGCSLDNRGIILGSQGGTVINTGAGLGADNLFGGFGGAGAQLTGGTHTNSGTIIGGDGGSGSNKGGSSGAAAGGAGLLLQGGATFVNEVGGTIQGGNGVISAPGGGPASTGGAGTRVTGATLENHGTITGGSSGSTAVNGEVAVIGTGGAIIINDGSIVGGTRSNGTVNNSAVSFAGSNNLLELRSNSSITGNVIAGATDTLALGGSTNASFNVAQIGSAAQYRGFGAYDKTGISTWTLTGTTTAVTPWTLHEGTLSVSADGNLGAASGGLTFDGGTLLTTAGFAMNRATTLNAGGGTIETDAGTTLIQNAVIRGSGSLTKQGAGTLQLTAINTYTGGTTITAGTLELGNGGTTGSIVGNIANNGTLVFNNPTRTTYADIISGTGAVSQIGAGTTVLTGENTYTGGTTIGTGTGLEVGSGTSGSIVGDVVNNGLLAFGRTDEVTFAGAISGTGQVSQLNSGKLILTGDSTYTGLTTILGIGSTVQLGDGGTSGSIVSDVHLNGSTLAFNRSDTWTFGGLIFGPGWIEQNGPGTTILTADNTFTFGDTTISAGTLQLGNGGLTGSIDGNITNNGTLAFDRSNAMILNGVISGSGAVNQIGTGTTSLTGVNTYTGLTTIGAGTLALTGVGSVAASSEILANSTFDVSGIAAASTSIQSLSGNSSGIVTLGAKNLTLSAAHGNFAGAIGGTGSVNVNAGTEIFTGTNTYTGGTTITAGTLQLGDGGTTGSIVGDVANDGTLIFNRSNQYDYAGIISGAGTVNQNGPGLTRLTANSGGFTGTTNVNAGTLSVNGILGGTMNVNGGRLQGTGQVGDTTNFAGGTIAPGNSIGTLLIGGNYIGSGGVLEMEGVLAGTGSPADRLLITGNATGSTQVHVINTGGAGAVTGAGNTDGISIIQVGGASTASTFQLAGGYAAAGPFQYTLKAFDPASSAAGEVDPLLAIVPFWDYRLQSLVDASGKPIAVPQIAGYQAMPTGAVRYGSSLLDSVHKRLGEIRETAALENQNGSSERDGERSKEVFLRTQGSSSDVSGNRASGYDQDIWYIQAGGNVFGRDMADGATLRIGGALSVGGSKLKADESSAKVDLDATTLALTTTYQSAAGWYLDGIAQGTRYASEITTIQRGKTGDPKGWGWGLSLEGGYPFDMGNGLILEPQAQLSYQRIRFDTFTDIDRIDVDLNDGESLRGRFGGRLLKTFADGTGREWSPFVEANLIHEFLSAGRITASGIGFDSDSSGTSVQFGGGLNAKVRPNTALYASLSYEKGVSSAAADTWGGNLGLRIDF